MRLYVIANGCPTPTPRHGGSAFLLDAGGEMVMVDCGPGATAKMARADVRPALVGRLFFTHHHYDHNADFPAFALIRWDHMRGDEPPLQVFGPPPTQRFVEQLLGEGGAFADDWKARVGHPASLAVHERRNGLLPRPAPAVEARDVGPGPVAKGKGWTAEARRVHHIEPFLESLAYRFETDDGSVLFAGDCGDCEALREFARGADTLVLACAFSGDFDPRIADVITGARQCGEIAAEAGARRVVLTHYSPSFYNKPGAAEQAVAEVARSFSGQIFMPEEGAVLDLDQ